MRKVKNDFKIQRKKTVYRHCGGHISHHFRNRIIYKDDNRPAAKHGTGHQSCPVAGKVGFVVVTVVPVPEPLVVEPLLPVDVVPLPDVMVAVPVSVVETIAVPPEIELPTEVVVSGVVVSVLESTVSVVTVVVSVVVVVVMSAVVSS